MIAIGNLGIVRVDCWVSYIWFRVGKQERKPRSQNKQQVTMGICAKERCAHKGKHTCVCPLFHVSTSV